MDFDARNAKRAFAVSAGACVLVTTLTALVAYLRDQSMVGLLGQCWIVFMLVYGRMNFDRFIAKARLTNMTQYGVLNTEDFAIRLCIAVSACLFVGVCQIFLMTVLA
jgi:hypothetical protein